MQFDEDLTPPEAIRSFIKFMKGMGEYKAPSWVYWSLLVASALTSVVLLIWPSTVLALTVLTLPPIAAFLRNVMGEREKMAWVIITLLLIAAVLVGLQKDERENREAQNAIVKSFQEVGKQISNDNDQNQARFDATMKEMGATLSTAQRVETLAEQNLESVTGGQSFAYLTPQMGVQPIPISIYNYGKNTLTGVTIRIYPPTQTFEDFTNSILNPLEIDIGTLPAGGPPRIVRGFSINPAPIKSIVEFRIEIAAQNFTVTQHLWFEPGVHEPLVFKTLVEKQFVKSKVGKTTYFGYQTLFQKDWPKK